LVLLAERELRLRNAPTAISLGPAGMIEVGFSERHIGIQCLLAMTATRIGDAMDDLDARRLRGRGILVPTAAGA
jgi:hypothetical protein